MIEALAFYMFSGVAVFAGLMVISAKNPVHSVLFLILAFFSAAALFVLLGAEFLAMIMLIVYVGAVAVLFMFVVMMLDVDFAELREGTLQYLPFGALVGIVLLVELIMVVATQTVDLKDVVAVPQPEASLSNTEAIGQLLYTDYIYFFQAAGLILLVAMIGAIVLSHRQRPGVRRQNIADQIRRTAPEAVELKKIKPGQGI